MKHRSAIAVMCLSTLAWAHSRGAQVLISEFMAANVSTLSDHDNDFSDWIEIYNQGEEATNLKGFFLTDDRRNLRKWEFPDIELKLGQYLVVFASGKNLRDTTQALHTNFKLSKDGEWFALVSRNGETLKSSFSYEEQTDDVSYGLDVNAGIPRFFSRPTPGKQNGEELRDRGPIFVETQHSMNQAVDGSSVTVTTKVDPTASEVDVVKLYFRIGFEDETEQQMTKEANGCYATELQLVGVPPGEMFRYRLEALDSTGAAGRDPSFYASENSPEYFGFIVSQQAALVPTLNWFVEEPFRIRQPGGSRASLSFNGVFHDNIHSRTRGRSSIQLFGQKQSYKFTFNDSELLAINGSAVRSINIQSSFSDKAFVRQCLALRFFADAGVVSPDAFPVVLRLNNDFHSLAIAVEQIGNRFIDQKGFRRGPLYKFIDSNGVSDAWIGVEKKTFEDQDHNDLHELVRALHAPEFEDVMQYIYEKIDLPSLINYLAVSALIQDRDNVEKNFYLFHDIRGTGRWYIWPWDKDLTFGRTWAEEGILNDRISYDGHPFFGARPELGPVHKLHWAVVRDPHTRSMFLRRLRSLIDKFLGSGYFEGEIANFKDLFLAHAVRDFEKWTPTYGEEQSPKEAISILEEEFLKPRKEFFLETLSEGLDRYSVNVRTLSDESEIGKSGVSAIVIAVINGSIHIRVFDSSGTRVIDTRDVAIPSSRETELADLRNLIKQLPIDRDKIVRSIVSLVGDWRIPSQQTSIQNVVLKTLAPTVFGLDNHGNAAVDVSGWKVAQREMTYTLKPGSVIPAGQRLTLAVDPDAIPATESRQGQPQLLTGFVQSDRTPLIVSNAKGEQVTCAVPIFRPGEALRITELHFNPATCPDDEKFESDDFEFVELYNAGDVPYSLEGLRFTEGINYEFPNVEITVGSYAIIARKSEAFKLRHRLVDIIGEYEGRLSNSGERIHMVDRLDNTILSLSYDDRDTLTDGGGHSLVFRPDSTSDAAWSRSVYIDGSPGSNEPIVPRTLLINEVGDSWIEIYNCQSHPTSLSDWFISDDINELQKWSCAEANDHFIDPKGTVTCRVTATGDSLFLSHLLARNARIADVADYAWKDDATKGRFPDGEEWYFIDPSPNQRNSYPQPGLRLTEIGSQYIEIFNLDANTLTLSGRFRLSGAVNFQFSDKSPIGAGETILLVPFDPSINNLGDEFRNSRGLPNDVPLFGPYSVENHDSILLQTISSRNTWTIEDESPLLTFCLSEDALVRTNPHSSGKLGTSWTFGLRSPGLYSGPASANVMLKTERARLTIVWPSMPGRVYDIYASTDLQSWALSQSGMLGTGGYLASVLMPKMPQQFFTIDSQQ